MEDAFEGISSKHHHSIHAPLLTLVPQKICGKEPRVEGAIAKFLLKNQECREQALNSW